MSSNYGNVNTGTGETSLDRPFVEILSKIFEAELLNEPEALNNLAWSLQALGTMTLDPEAGTAVKELNDLTHRVHSLINAHLENEINAMQTRDDDTIDYFRRYSQEAITKVNRVISRYIIKIVTFSFTNGPMAGCTIKNTAKLSFNTQDEFQNALRSVIDELITLGFGDVAQALINNSNIEIMKPSEDCPDRFGAVSRGKRKFGSVRYHEPSVGDELSRLHNQPFAAALAQIQLKKGESHA